MNIFSMLRDKEEQEEHSLSRSDLVARIAQDFDPKEDITAYELALVFKVFAMLSNDMDIEDVKEKAMGLNTQRHFNFKD